jgi:predicted enzyme related to lactoylglutathione lyase
VSSFRWHDLAAADPAAALRFYGAVLGWASTVQRANGGSFLRLHSNGSDVASMYALSRAHLEAGVPSHWTPYWGVDDVDATARRVRHSGGRVVVAPFDVEGMASIALVSDPSGAIFGLWQELRDERQQAD